jgi:hypothetical protein
MNNEHYSTSFNGVPLKVGDTVYAVMGKHLKKGTIESFEDRHMPYCKVKLKGTKTLISPRNIVKI